MNTENYIMKNSDSKKTLREGLGTKNDPYRSADGTAGIQAALGELADRGGLLSLDCGRYDIYKSVVFETPSLALDGGVWACNTDPNGVFETDFGTKIRMRGTDYPALVMGRERPCVSGAIIRNLGIQGDIVGIMVIVSRNSMISRYFDTISLILCQIFYKNLD